MSAGEDSFFVARATLSLATLLKYFGGPKGVVSVPRGEVGAIVETVVVTKVVPAVVSVVLARALVSVVLGGRKHLCRHSPCL